VVDFHLDGHQALVTGAGRGLGKAIADGLVELGATVYGTSRDADVARQIGERCGTPPQVLEVSNEGDMDGYVVRLQETSGGIDMPVNNAGVKIAKPAIELTGREWDTVLDTNLKRAFLRSTAFARTWLERRTPGSFVYVPSPAGTVTIEERAACGTSKAGLIHLARILALEWAHERIGVNAVAPTFVRTKMTAETLSRPDWAAELLSRIPVGRFGEPDDVVGAVAFLLGDAASLITGHTLAVDGGYTIH
jgi:NAD(P)-dependent dehydrogenase (short-subunit alcohol dehydrogenase family)